MYIGEEEADLIKNQTVKSYVLSMPNNVVPSLFRFKYFFLPPLRHN
jgi:hypothetical protein